MEPPLVQAEDPLRPVLGAVARLPIGTPSQMELEPPRSGHHPQAKLQPLLLAQPPPEPIP